MWSRNYIYPYISLYQLDAFIQNDLYLYEDRWNQGLVKDEDEEKANEEEDSPSKRKKDGLGVSDEDSEKLRERTGSNVGLNNTNDDNMDDKDNNCTRTRSAYENLRFQTVPKLQKDRGGVAPLPTW